MECLHLASKGANIKKNNIKDFPGGAAVGTPLPLQGAWVQSLVRELGSCMSRGVAKKTPKLKQQTNKNSECVMTQS